MAQSQRLGQTEDRLSPPRGELHWNNYVGLDVSLKEACICVIDGVGNRVWQGKCSPSPDDVEEVIKSVLHARCGLRWKLALMRLALGRTSAASVPVVCIYARHAKAALMMQLNQTDQNEAYGLA